MRARRAARREARAPRHPRRLSRRRQARRSATPLARERGCRWRYPLQRSPRRRRRRAVARKISSGGGAQETRTRRKRNVERRSIGYLRACCVTKKIPKHIVTKKRTQGRQRSCRPVLLSHALHGFVEPATLRVVRENGEERRRVDDHLSRQNQNRRIRGSHRDSSNRAREGKHNALR